MFQKSLMFTIALLIIAVPAHAQKKRLYLGGGMESFKAGDDSEVSLMAVKLKLGYDIFNFLALEGHVGTTDTYSETPIKYTIDYFVGGFARANLRIGSFIFYGIGGYTHFSTKASFAGVSERDTASVISYGGGIELVSGNQNNTLGLYWIQYQNEDNDGVAFNSYGLGISHYFTLPSISKRY